MSALDDLAEELVRRLEALERETPRGPQSEALRELVNLAVKVADGAFDAQADALAQAREAEIFEREARALVEAAEEVVELVVPLLPHHMGVIDDPWARRAVQSLRGAAS